MTTAAPQDLPGDGQRIVGVTLDEHTVVRRHANIENERAVAMFDLLERNSFRPFGVPAAATNGGPFHLHLAVEDRRLLLDIETPEPDRRRLDRLTLPLQSFSKVIRDYFLVCESYFEALAKSGPAQIEAIDMGRRGLHDEGAELLRERLADRVDIDADTARRLFTLICVLHIRA